MKNSGLRNLISTVKFKIVMLVLTVISFIAFFIIPLSEFRTDDTVPKLEVVDLAKLESMQTRAFSVKVDTGLFIKSFSVFDPINNNFVMDGILWFEFDSGSLMTDVIEKFSFDNGKMLYKSPPDIKVIGERIFVKYNIRVSFKSNLKYSRFPFGDHKVTIILSNNFVAPEEMYFQVDESLFDYSPDIVLHDWTIVDLDVEAGYTDLQLDKNDPSKRAAHPKVLFVINIIKAGARRVLIIFIPLMTVIFFSLLSFLLSVSNLVGRFSITISAVTALLGYRFVIERMMPSVSYFTTTDMVYTVLLLFALLCFVFQLIFTRNYSFLKHEPSGKQPEIHGRYVLLNDIVFIFADLILIFLLGFIFLS